MAENRKRGRDEDEAEDRKEDTRPSVKQKGDLVVETVSNSTSGKYIDLIGPSDQVDQTQNTNGGSAGGFLAYAKINPFAAAAAQGNAFGQQSPLSPKLNPFSTTSPVHNPFMSFVDKKEEYWQMMSTKPSLAATSALFGFNSDTVKNTLINAKNDNSNSIVDTTQTNPSSQATSPNQSDDDDDEDKGDREGESPLNSPCSGGEDDSNSAVKLMVPVTVMNGEEGEDCVFQVRAKLFRLGAKEIVEPHTSSVKFSTTDSLAESKETTKTGDVVTGEKTSVANPADADSNKASREGPDMKAVVSAASDSVKSAVSGSKVLEWIEVGTGPVRILKPSVRKPPANDESTGNPPASNTSPKDLRPRIVMRREGQPGGHGTKLILNAFLHGHVDISKMGEKAIKITLISSDGENNTPRPASYLLKTKLSQDADKMESWLRDLLRDQCMTVTK